MIPKILATATRATRISSTTARAITCQRRIPAVVVRLSAPSCSRSSIGSSTLASCRCCDTDVAPSSISSSTSSTKCSGFADTRLQQKRDNSISVSAAATLMGSTGSYTDDENEGSRNSFLDSALLDNLKRINDAVGRRKGRAKSSKHTIEAKSAAALAENLGSVKDLLTELQETQSAALNESSAEPTRSPSIDMARSMPKSCQEMDNSSLMCLAALDFAEARSEVLRRHIMDVDDVDYADACRVYEDIRGYNNSIIGLGHTLPYRIGIATATVAAFASIPLCFHLGTVEFFNANFVNVETPDPASLQTFLGVGAHSWEWMEPPLGQLSFMILCLQVARNQMGTLGHKPYGGIIKSWRARKLSQHFPKYDEHILMSYSKSVPLVGGSAG